LIIPGVIYTIKPKYFHVRMAYTYKIKKWENFIADYERDVFHGISIGNDFVFNIIFYRCLRSIPMAYALRHAAPAFCRGYINMLFRYFLVDKNEDKDEDDNTLFNMRMDKKVSYYSIDFDSNSKELAFAKLFYEKACKGADKQKEMKKGGMSCDAYDDFDGVTKRGKVNARKHKLSAANYFARENVAMMEEIKKLQNSDEPNGMRNKQDFIAYVQCCVEILNHGDLRTGRHAAINQFEDDSLKGNRATIFKQWMLWSPNNSQQFSKCYWPESLGLYYTGCVIITAREYKPDSTTPFDELFNETMNKSNWNVPSSEQAEIRDWLKLRPINVFLNEVKILKVDEVVQIHINKIQNIGAVTWTKISDDVVMGGDNDEPSETLQDTLLIQLVLNDLVKETEHEGGYISSLGELLPKLLISTGNRDKCMPALKYMRTRWTDFEFSDKTKYVDKCWKDSGRSQIIKNAVTNVRRIIRRKAIQAAALYMDRNKSGKTVSGDKSYYKSAQSGENRPFPGKYRMEGFDADTWLDGYKTNPEKSRVIDKTTKGGTPGRERMTRPRHQPQRLGDYDDWWDIEEKERDLVYRKFTHIDATQKRLDNEDKDVNLWQTLERIRHLVSGGDGLPAWHDKMFQKGGKNYESDAKMPGGYRKGTDNWVGRSSRTGNFNTEAAHTAIPIKQVVNMVMNDLLTASGPIMYNDGDTEYYEYTPEKISGPYSVESTETIIVDRLNPISEHSERGKFSQVEYSLSNFKLSRNDNDGSTDGEFVWTWEHLRTVEDGSLWKKIMVGLFEEGVYQWNASPDVFMGLATAHWWVDDADAALETAKNLGWQRDIVQHGIRKLERPTFIRGMEKPTKDEMVVFWSNIIFFILNSNNERPYIQYWLPKPIARPAMVWSGATINANMDGRDKCWLTTILAILSIEKFPTGVLYPPRNDMPRFTCIVELFKNVIFKLIKMLYPGGTNCNIRFVDDDGTANIISRGSGYEKGDILVVRFRLNVPNQPMYNETMYNVEEVDDNGGVVSVEIIPPDGNGLIKLEYTNAIDNDAGFDTYTLTKNRGNFYTESHYNEVFGEEALKKPITMEQLHWIDNNPYYPNPVHIMARVCQMLQPYLCQRAINVIGAPSYQIICCRKRDNSQPVFYDKIGLADGTGKTDYRHVRYATTSTKSYESQQRDNNSWFNYTVDGSEVKPWLFKDDMLTREVFEGMAGDLAEEDEDFEWIKEWWGRMQGKTTGPMFKRGGHLQDAGDVFGEADFGHIEVQLPAQWGETSEIDTIGGYFFPFYENHKLKWKDLTTLMVDEDEDDHMERDNMPENVLLEGRFETVGNGTESQKIVTYPISVEKGVYDQRISLNMAELRNILTKTVHDESVADVVMGLVDNDLIPNDTSRGSYLENIWEIREAYTIWKVQHYMFLHEFVSDVEAINSGRGAWDAFRSQDKATTQRWHRGKPRKLVFNNDTNGDNYNRDIYEETRIPQIQHYLGVRDDADKMRVTPWSHRGYENTAIALTQVHSSMGVKPSYKFRNMTIGFYEAVQDIANLQNQADYVPYKNFAELENGMRMMQPQIDENMRNWTKEHEDAPAQGYLITGNRTNIRIRGVRLDRKKAYSSVKGWYSTFKWYSDPDGNGFSQPTKTSCQPRVIMQTVANDMYIGPERPEHKKSGLIFYMNDRHSEMLIGGFYPFFKWRYSQQLQRLDVDRDDNLKHIPCINNYTALAKIIRARDEWYVDAVEKNLLNIPDENYYNCVPIKDNEQLERFVLVKTLPTPFFRIIVNTFFNGKGQNAVRDWELIKNELPPKPVPEKRVEKDGVIARRTSSRIRAGKETITRGSLSDLFLELKF
jgi:hypothetical protein